MANEWVQSLAGRVRELWMNERQDSEKWRGPWLLGWCVGGGRMENGAAGVRQSEDRAPSSLGVWHGLAIGMGAAR
jgi:hypothetical protein